MQAGPSTSASERDPRGARRPQPPRDKIAAAFESADAQGPDPVSIRRVADGSG